MKNNNIVACIFATLIALMFIAYMAFSSQVCAKSVNTKHLRAVDGDTIYNKQDDVYYRLADIDTPEKGECGYREAKNFLALALVSRLYLEFDELYTDVYGRQVIETNDNLSRVILENGYARPYIINKNDKNYKLYWKIYFNTTKVCDNI